MSPLGTISQLFSQPGTSGVGLEISDTSVKIASLRINRSRFAVSGVGGAPLELGTVVKGKIKDRERLGQALRLAASSAQPTPVALQSLIFAVPEYLVYTYSFFLTRQAFEDTVKSKKLETLIRNAAERYIPIGSKDLLITHRITRRRDQTVQIFVVGTERSALLEWDAFFKSIGIVSVIFDIPAFATFRVLFAESQKNGACIIDIGDTVTTVFLFNADGLVHSYLLVRGGETITTALMSKLSISHNDAEEIKRIVGLSDPAHAAYPILVEQVQPILADVARTLLFFQKNSGLSIPEAISIGGTSVMPGYAEYASSAVGIPVRIGGIPHESDAKAGGIDGYMQVIGMAMRALDKRWERTDPAFTSAQLIVKEDEHSEGAASTETPESTFVRLRKQIFKI